jgi:hypothetical protein
VQTAFGNHFTGWVIQHPPPAQALSSIAYYILKAQNYRHPQNKSFFKISQKNH